MAQRLQADLHFFYMQSVGEDNRPVLQRTELKRREAVWGGTLVQADLARECGTAV